MNIPSKNRKWLKEIKRAYNDAEKLVVINKLPIQYIYTYAAELVAKKRGILSPELVTEMRQATIAAVERDCDLDEESHNHYKFHFVSGYIFAHVIPEYITAMEGDRIMEYVNSNWDLFNKI
jgi:hypothetical protein